MVRHCVFIRFRADVSDAEINGLLDAIVDLRCHLAGILDVHVAPNSSPEVGMDRGYAHGFIVDFETAADRDRYLADDRHRAVGAELVRAAAGGTDGIFVYDLEI
ncbi:MAG: Dabb family protein [Ilumatobacter sp.]